MLAAVGQPSTEVSWNDQLQFAADRLVDQVALQATPQEWVVGVANVQQLPSLTSQYGLVTPEPTGTIANAYRVELPATGNLSAAEQTAAGVQKQLMQLPGVRFAFPLIGRQWSPRLIPNDSLFSDQWHLNNTGQRGGIPGEDVNITSTWDDFTGNGVVIGIVDDGLEHAHTDLSGNYRSDLSYDFNNDDPDPTPDSTFDNHGTAVAGVAAAVGNNAAGVVGAAFDAELAGLRLISGPVSDQTEANALSWQSASIDIYSNSWGPEDDATRLEGPGPLTLAAFEQSILSGRGGLGSIYTWAGGNGGPDDNVNYDGYANSRYTIAVGAVGDDGQEVFYSEPGASLLIAAPTDGSVAGITTTTVGGGYTSNFGGTSSSAPLASGVIALALEANPNLSWRDVQHLLVNTARMNDPTDADWAQNSAGHDINHKFGFGVIDAGALVSAAGTWLSVAPEVSASSGVINVGQAIADNNPTGTSSSFTVGESIQLESVEVVLDADHTFRGNLQVVLTSPSGTESVLAESHNDFNNDYDNWTFSSVRHWDELAQGQWTLTLRDLEAGNTGTFNSWQLNLYGTATDEQPTDPPTELTDFTAQPPLGSLVYGQTTVTSIESAAEIDTFAIDLTQGNTFSLAVAPAGSLAPQVTVRDSLGQQVASDSAAAGQGVVIQTLPVAASGTYQVSIAGANNTTGNYTLDVLLNASIEQERFGGADNANVPQALSGEASFAELDRQAVVGQLQTTDDSDWYWFQTSPGESFTLAASAGQDQDGFTLELYDDTSTLLAHSHANAANVDQLIDDFTTIGSADPTTYYVRVVPDGSLPSVDYALLLTRQITFDQEPNNTLGPLAQPLASNSTRVLGYTGGEAPLPSEQEPNDDGIPGGSAADLPLANNLQNNFQAVAPATFEAQITGTIAAGNDGDWDFYRISAAEGDSLTVALNGNSLSDPYLRLYNRNGNQIALNDDGGPGLDSLLNFSAFTYEGDYFIVADSYGSRIGSYTLTATLDSSALASDAVDYYQLPLNSGTPLTVSATAPGSGGGQFENTLQPQVELYNAVGVLVANGAGALSFTPSASELHTLAVRDASGAAAGEYLLTVNGALPSPAPAAPQVLSITPLEGSRLAATPGEIVIEFDQRLRLDTVEAADLLLDGQAALSVTVIDSFTLSFAPPPLAAGLHTVQLPLGAVANWQGVTSAEFQSEFEIDVTGPRVIDSTLQQNDRLAEGLLTVTLEFDEPLDVTTLDRTDISLTGTQGSPDSFLYNPSLQTLSFTYNSLLDDLYQLRLDSSPSGFRDPTGNLLDGEPLAFPIGPNVSGDGSPGGDFTIEFEVDLDSRAAQAPVRLAPLGSFVAESRSNVGVLGSVSDLDRYTLDLHAGHTIVVVAESTDPTATLSLQIPGLSSLVSAPAPGEAVRLPLTQITATGSVGIELTTDAVTSYSLDIYLNAAVELGGGDSSDTTPLALDSTQLTLGAARYAVVGELPAGVPQSTDTFTVDLTGRTGAPLDILFATPGSGGPADATLELLAPNGSVVATAVSDPLGTDSQNFDQAVLGYALPTEGIYQIRVTSGDQGGRYSLTVTDSLSFEVESNDLAIDPLRELTPGLPELGFLGTSDSNQVAETALAPQSASEQVGPRAKTPEHDHSHSDREPLVILPPSEQLLSYDGLLSGPSAADPLTIAQQFLNEHAMQFGLTPEGVGQLELTDRYASSHTGTTHLYFRQTHDGLPVLNATLNVNVTAAGEVINAAGGAVPGLSHAVSKQVVAPALSATSAVAALADYLEWHDVGPIQAAATVPTKNLRTSLRASEFARQDIPISLAYAPTGSGGVELVWHLNVDLIDGSHWVDAAVSATSGEALYWADYVSHATYNVFPAPLESPNFGPRELEVDPHNLVASPQAWHDTDGNPGAEFTITRGNNVNAYSDRNDDNQPDLGSQPDGGASLVFDFPLDESLNPSTFQPAAVTNLFYWNNVIHDVLYQYGFDEPSGNFQVNNYGNGGAQGDAVQAEAQDGADVGKANNANFATPPDGSSPRMQMFLWTNPTRDGDFDNGIIVHEYGHGVSNRLTGGPGNSGALNALQSGGMGEGWSDWLGLMFSQQAGDSAPDPRTIGTYALGQSTSGPGIRTQPYSYDMSVNDLTYARVATQAAPHGLGEIWNSALWDLNWLLIEGSNLDPRLPAGLGFDADLYDGTGGNNVALQLVLDGMKLQPANPSFLDARDALLAADQAAFGGAHSAHIWLAFARRGMGFSADDGGSANSRSVTEAFDLPATSQGQLRLDQEFYEEGDLVEVTLRDADLDPGATTTVNIQASSGDIEPLTLTPQGLGIFIGSIQLVSGPATADGLLQAAVNQQIEVTYNDADTGSGNPATVSDSAFVLNVVELADFDFSDAAGNAFDEGFTTTGSNNQWHLSTGRGTDPGHSADDSFYFGAGETASGGGTYLNNAQGVLTSPLLDLTDAAVPLTFSFNHFLDTESFYDEASLTVVADGNRTTLLSMRGGSLPVQTGGFVNQQLDLSSFIGQQITLEFEFDSDGSIINEGWYLDDIRLSAIVYEPNLAGPLPLSFDPPAGMTDSVTVDRLTIDFDEALEPTSAENPANYQLLYAGANGQFEGGTGDDLLIPFTATPLTSTQVELLIDSTFAALAPGNYRLTLKGDEAPHALRDPAGNPLGSIFGPGSGEDMIHEFSIETDLSGGIDRYSLQLAAGEEVAITTETPYDSAAALPGNSLDPRLIVVRENGSIVATDSGSGTDGKNASLIFTADATGSYQVLVVGEAGGGEYLLRAVLTNQPAQVVGRHLFYDNSAFDQFTGGPNVADDLALATDLTALRPGEQASAVNISSFVQGINGIAIDVEQLADSNNLSRSDFEFRLGNDNDPDSWSLAPPPSGLEVQPVAGSPGVERIYLTWNAGEILGQWLEVRLRSTAATGLSADDLFYFGSSPADADADGQVDAIDFSATRVNPRNFLSPATVTTDHDYNRDGRVNGTDLQLVREFTTQISGGLLMIEPPNSLTLQKVATGNPLNSQPEELDELTLDSTFETEHDWLA